MKDISKWETKSLQKLIVSAHLPPNHCQAHTIARVDVARRLALSVAWPLAPRKTLVSAATRAVDELLQIWFFEQRLCKKRPTFGLAFHFQLVCFMGMFLRDVGFDNRCECSITGFFNEL
jgi:hypothetical protein